MIKEAKVQDALIELNNASFNTMGFRIQAYENDIQILKLCVKYGVEIMLGSDAHREEDVGDFTRTEKILKEVNFPEVLMHSLQSIQQLPVPKKELILNPLQNV